MHGAIQEPGGFEMEPWLVVDECTILCRVKGTITYDDVVLFEFRA